MKRRLRERLRGLEPRIVVFAQAAGIGMPSVDYLLCAAGRFVAIEVKRDVRHHPTPRQASTLAKVRAAGGLTFVVNDDTSLAHCISELTALCSGKVE